MLFDKNYFHKCSVCGKECSNIGSRRVLGFLLYGSNKKWKKFYFCYDHRDIGWKKNNKSIVQYLQDNL